MARTPKHTAGMTKAQREHLRERDRAFIAQKRLEGHTWPQILELHYRERQGAYTIGLKYAQSLFREYREAQAEAESDVYNTLAERIADELSTLGDIALNEFRNSGEFVDTEVQEFTQHKKGAKQPTVYSKSSLTRKGQRPKSAAYLNTAIAAKKEAAKLLGLYEQEAGGTQVNVILDSFND